MIQDIVVNLTIGRARDAALDYAVSVAETFEADLTGIAFLYDPIVMPTATDTMPPDFIESQRVENAKAVEAAIARFKRATAKTELPARTQTVEASMTGAPNLFGRIARTYDLAIAAQPEPGNAVTNDLIVEAALFESGRPVIVVPYIQESAFKLDRVMVCWNNSRRAARALADAMPVLEFAKSVEVVVVETANTKNAEEHAAEVVQHLARHDLKAQTKSIVTDGNVTAALLSHAADSNADLMVMGGYGHSRLREFFLGGVTRGVLDAMTIPVLMSH